jgi:hypothetical protein
LAEAQCQGSLEAELRRLSHIPLLIIDEVGYVRFDPEAASLMFGLISARYERASWVGGTQAVLATKTSYAFANGNSLALVDQGSTVSAWTKTGSEFTQLLSASDSTYSGGQAAPEGAGNITRLTNFKAGIL